MRSLEGAAAERQDVRRIHIMLKLIVAFAVFGISAVQVLVGRAGPEVPSQASPNHEEIAIYFEALRVIRNGSIDGVKLGGPVQVVRWTSVERGYVRIPVSDMPKDFRDAIAAYRRSPIDREILDLSVIDFDDVMFTEIDRIDAGSCRVSFSPIGFGEDMLTAVTRVRIRCETKPASADDLLICLKSTKWGWKATGFAKLYNSNLRLFRASDWPFLLTAPGSGWWK